MKLHRHENSIVFGLEWTGSSPLDMVPLIVNPFFNSKKRPETYDPAVDYSSLAEDSMLVLNNSVSELKDLCFSKNMLHQQLSKSVLRTSSKSNSDCLRFRRSNQLLEKNLECPYQDCSKHYASRSSLKLHMKNSHQINDPKKSTHKDKLSSLMYKCHVHSAKLDPSTVITQKRPAGEQISSTDHDSVKNSGNSSNSEISVKIGNDYTESSLMKRDFDCFNDSSTKATPFKTESKYCPEDNYSTMPRYSEEKSYFPLNAQQYPTLVEQLFGTSEISPDYTNCVSDALETNSFDDFLINDNPFNDNDENQSFLKE
jgi:hypothetical protein